jgi:glutathione S-transferase
MALTIYGSPRSRTMRTLWTAAELGLTYTHNPVAWDDPALKESEFLRLNPAGTIPTIVDDDYALAESLAINLYLARKYGSRRPAPLYPADPRDEADVWRWTLWAQASLEPWVQNDRRFETLRLSAADVLDAAILAGLATLERALSDREWLVGAHFTVADLNVAGVLSPSRARRLDLEHHPHTAKWLTRCYDRPAARATRERFSA